jgi:hypothetical protein
VGGIRLGVDGGLAVATDHGGWMCADRRAVGDGGWRGGHPCWLYVGGMRSVRRTKVYEMAERDAACCSGGVCCYSAVLGATF